MKVLYDICSLFSSFIVKHIDWISCLILLPLAYETYIYFFEYDKTYVSSAIYFQTYSDINWVSFVFLFGHFKSMRSIGWVSLAGMLCILAANTYHLHFKFCSTTYFTCYIGFVFMFLLFGYISILFRYLEKLFEIPEY